MTVYLYVMRATHDHEILRILVSISGISQMVRIEIDAGHAAIPEIVNIFTRPLRPHHRHSPRKRAC